jgi:hypothetical protein
MRRRANRGRYPDSVREVTDERNRDATKALAKALSNARFQDAAARPPLTFEQQLELVRQGRARVVEKVPMVRPLAYMPSQLGGCMS